MSYYNYSCMLIRNLLSFGLVLQVSEIIIILSMNFKLTVRGRARGGGS